MLRPVATFRKGIEAMGTQNSSDIVNRIAPSGLLTTDQAAAYLAVKPGTLQVWRSTNRKVLPYVKIGGQVRYRQQDLDAFIASNLRNVAAA